MSRAYAPPEVIDLAHARREARIAGDWPRADELRAEIEAAGWTVVDRGVDFQLRPAVPPDVDRDGTTFYGAAGSVPSRLDEPASSRATVVAVAFDAATLTGIVTAAALLPSEVDLVAVANGIGEEIERGGGDGTDAARLEVVGTAGRFRIGAALNAGLRRSRGVTAIVLDSASGDDGRHVADLIAWLADGGIGSLERSLVVPTAAIVGLTGYASDDLRRFTTSDDREPVAVGGSIVAFRRADLLARGPLDERLGSQPAVDIWWSLVLRDEGEAQSPRRAVRLDEGPSHPGLGASGDQARLPRRDAYRLADRFAGSPHLLPIRDRGAASEAPEPTTA
ncbi:MAG: hypothetical protein ACHQ3P_08030 [Candidatus Limnocylindrales bacterium]